MTLSDAEPAHRFELLGAATPVTSAPGRRDLGGEVTDAAGRAEHQHLLTGLHGTSVARRLQGGVARDRHRSGLLEHQVAGFGASLVVDRGVLGEGAVGAAVDLVADRRPGDAGPDRSTTPARSMPGDGRFGSAEAIPARRIG